MYYNIMVRKLIRIGTSHGVTLDKKMLKAVGMSGATYVVIEPDKNKKQILIRKKTESDW